MRNTSLYRLLVGQVEGFGPQTVIETLAEVMEDLGYGERIPLSVLPQEVPEAIRPEPAHHLRVQESAEG